jgi:dTDP-4-amino-4,6-dideoxygalactose transaminase
MSNYEINFADKFSATHAFSFWKAHVALYAILKSLGIGEGDEVILPGYTCVMDVNPIKYVGAKPVYVDIEPVTYNMDVTLLEQKITGRTKLIIAQHTYGYPCEMDAILDIANKHNIPVIEDCCLAFGSTYKGKLCGTFSKAAYFSFQWNKPFTTGLGGMGVVNDQDLANRIETLRQNELCYPSTKASMMLAIQRMVYRMFIYPRTTALATNLFRWLTKKGLVVGSSGTCEFAPEMADDFFMAMGTAQARSGLRQLEKLDKNIAHRRKMRTVYDQLLTDAGFDIPKIPDYMDPVLVRYPLRVADKEKALAEAPAHGVEVGSWFECPLHPIETPMHLYDYEQGMCPVAEKASREVINLPTHPRAGLRTAKRTVEFIRQIGPA